MCSIYFYRKLQGLFNAVGVICSYAYGCLLVSKNTNFIDFAGCKLKKFNVLKRIKRGKPSYVNILLDIANEVFVGN